MVDVRLRGTKGSTDSPTKANIRFLRQPSGGEGNRTPDLLNAIQALSQLSYGPRRRVATAITTRVFNSCRGLYPQAGPTGLEPATSGVTVRHSNRLSYGPLCAFTSTPQRACGTQSGQPGSNRRPQPWQGCALPTELLPQEPTSVATGAFSHRWRGPGCGWRTRPRVGCR